MSKENNNPDWQIYLAERLDAINNKVEDIRVEVIKNTGSLDEHMRRTDLLEEEVKLLRALLSWIIFPVELVKKLLGMK